MKQARPTEQEELDKEICGKSAAFYANGGEVEIVVRETYTLAEIKEAGMITLETLKGKKRPGL